MTASNDELLAQQILDEFPRDFYVPSVFNDAALRRRIVGALARMRYEERERCAQVCLTIETELSAAAEKHHTARRYDEYERLESEATTVSIVKDRIRALADEAPVPAET